MLRVTRLEDNLEVRHLEKRKPALEIDLCFSDGVNRTSR